MIDATRIAQRYIATWNEADAAQRRELIARVFTEDATYVDPVMAGSGHDGIDAMIAAAQQQFPGFRFTLVGTAEAHNDRIRFSWSLGAAGAPPAARGTDFAVVAADGRLRAVTGFLDSTAAEVAAG